MGIERLGRSLSEQAIAAMRRNELKGIVRNVENFLTESHIAKMTNEEWANFVARIFERHDKFERQAATTVVKTLSGSKSINPDIRVGTAVKKAVSYGIDPDVRVGTKVKQNASRLIDPDARISQ